MVWAALRDTERPGDAPQATQTAGRDELRSPADTAAEKPTQQIWNAPAPPYVADENAGRTWSTYHGGTALAGLVNTNLPDNPKVLWRFQTDTPVYQTPVSCGERIYFCTYKGRVFALDLEGNELWSKRLVREVREDGTERMEILDAPPACFKSTLLVGSMRGKLHAFDAATGNENWMHDLGGPILGTVSLQPAGNPSENDQILVIGQEYGTLHSIDLTNGKEIWQTDGIDRCDGSPSVLDGRIVFGSCAAALHVFSATDGTLIRNIEIDPDSQIAGGVALVGQSAFSGSHSGKVIHANAATGEIVWINEDSYDEVLTTPAVSRDFVVFGSYDGIVYALDRETGIQKWKFETDGIPTSPVIAGDKVVIGIDGVLYLLQLDSGEELWSYEVSDEITSPAIINGMIVVGSEDGTVTAFGDPQG